MLGGKMDELKRLFEAQLQLEKLHTAMQASPPARLLTNPPFRRCEARPM
jgi:hypothetical protein